jgi:protein SCO1/2
MKKVCAVLLSIAFLGSCNLNEAKQDIRVPSIQRKVDGKIINDTATYLIPEFALWDQDSALVTNKDIAGKIVVADFFFISCPSICAQMKANMISVNDSFYREGNVVILSHTIDPKRDTVGALKKYTAKLEVKGSIWRFLTGSKDSIFAMADKYLTPAEEDPNSPGGFAHSGNFILCDGNQRIRGFYDGTKAEDTQRLIADIRILLSEKQATK